MKKSILLSVAAIAFAVIGAFATVEKAKPVQMWIKFSSSCQLRDLPPCNNGAFLCKYTIDGVSRQAYSDPQCVNVLRRSTQ